MKQSTFDYSFLGLGLLIQVVTFVLSGSLLPGSGLSWLSLLSGCLGICSVCLTAQGRILTYAFGFAQVGTYTWICFSQRFYGEMAVNAYYFVTMLYGVYVWRNRLAAERHTVTTRRLRPSILLLVIALMLAGSGLAGWGLSVWTDDTQPFLDAFTTVPALVAQVLMICVYREHWFIWFAVDILNVLLWLRAGDWCMVAQYAFWCANCIYGYTRWAKLEH